MRILVTGGLGYIGSHTCVELLAAGHEVVVIDNLVNANASVQQRIENISGKTLTFVKGDLRDRRVVEAVFAAHRLDAVIHFAGLKAVGESVVKPLRYYDNNISGSLILFETMAVAGVKILVFSSSATVYGNPARVPIMEDFPLSATNAYGRSKLMIEDILRDVAQADASWHIALLRFFNPIGAHESGMIGEEPNGIPNNLLPYIAQVADGRRAKLSVFGNQYATVDGTGMRDYIHVVDLAIGHVKTLNKLTRGSGVLTYNLGTGRGSTVLEMVDAFEQVCGKPIPYEIVARRPGDIAICYADPSRANAELEWTAERSITQMCADSWRYQTMVKPM